MIGKIKYYYKKYEKMPVQTKASICYTICNIMQKGISFIVIPIYIRILTQTEYGQYSIFQSWCNILIVFATLNLYCGVYTKAMVDYEKDRDRYTSCMQGLSTLITCVCVCIYLVAQSFWDSIFKMDSITICLMFLYFLFYPGLMFWTVKQRVEYKYKSMVLVTILVSVLTPCVSIVMLLNTDLRVNAVIWGYLIVQSIGGLYFYISQFIKGKTFFVKEYWCYALKFNIPLIPHYLSLIVLGQADRIMIENYCGADKAGIYNLAYQISMIMNIFVAAINNSLVPWIYEMLKTKAYSKIKSVTNKLCLLVGIMTICAILMSPEAVLFIGKKAYMDAIWTIPAVAISVYVTFCYGLFSNVEFYYGATKFVMIASTVGAVLNIILNALFIPKGGFVVAGYTTLVCYIVFMIMHLLFMKRICKKNICGEMVYDIKFIVLSCIVICVVGALCLGLYKISVLRYFILVLIVVMMIVKRKALLATITAVKG